MWGNSRVTRRIWSDNPDLDTELPPADRKREDPERPAEPPIGDETDELVEPIKTDPGRIDRRK